MESIDEAQRIDMLVDDDGKAKLWVVPNFSHDLYDQLATLDLAHEPEIILGGHVCHQRRDIGFYSDYSQGYGYSGTFAPALSFDEAPFLRDLMHEVNAYLGTDFNGILVNRYRNGEKYLSHHSDEKRFLDKNNFMVAGIAYGPGIRKFRIRKKVPGKPGPIILDHHHQPCELLVMEGAFQERYTHEIPVEKRIKAERISVTFRRHLV